MEKLDLIQKNILMSSRVIAELTDKRHDHIKRDIKKQLEVQNIDVTTFGGIYLDAYKREQHEFRLDYNQTMILVSGYSVLLRSKIISRWTELEQQNKPALPSYAETLRLYAGEIEKNEALELEAKQNAPKVELATQCLRDETTMSIRDAGKHLGLSQTKIFSIMRDNAYLTIKRLPTQKALDRKVLDVKTNSTDNGNKSQAVMTMENIMNFQKRHLQPKGFATGGIVMPIDGRRVRVGE